MDRRFLDTPEAVADAVRDARRAQCWTQAELASRARVGRRFIVTLESAHERAELCEVLSVLEALEIHAVALPDPPEAQPSEEVNLDDVIKRFT